MGKRDVEEKWQRYPSGALTRGSKGAGGAASNYDDVYVRRDGTTPMLANWDAGVYEIESTYFDADTEYRFGGTHILSAVASPTLNLYVGSNTLGSVTTGNYLTHVGAKAGGATTSGDSGTHVGCFAGEFQTSGNAMTNVGTYAGNKNNADYGTNVGHEAGGYGNDSGFGNTNIGAGAGAYADTGGYCEYNVNVGFEAGEGSNGNSLYDDCVHVGTFAGEQNRTADGQVAIGRSAAENNQAGGYGVFLGYKAGQNETTANRLYIANSNTTTPLIYGEFDNLEVGINVGSSCAATLHVDQSATDGAKPVLLLDQADIDVVLMKIVGSAAVAGVDYTLVADSDFGTPGALVGWIQVEIQDDGNRITDGDYYIPFYAAPS